MSSGGSLPYHLRQNKSVDRALFIDLLSRVNGEGRNVSEYQYIGFGGPFMEDFKDIHQKTKIKDMISIEKDENVRKRQIFNKPISCIDFSVGAEESTSFLENYSFEKTAVVWFDFTNFELYSQFSDFYNLLKKVPLGSIVKITINANPSNIKIDESDADEEKSRHLALQELRYNKVKEDLGEFFSSANVELTDMTFKGFPGALLKCLNRVRSRITLEEPNSVVCPLSAFVYSDGQQMLTATAIVVHKDFTEELEEHPRIASWDFYNQTWSKPIDISLPVISQKERLHIESMLPDSLPDEIIDSFEFHMSDSPKKSKDEISNFVNYYRIFPWFGKFSL